jgi:hypothetical protein
MTTNVTTFRHGRRRCCSDEQCCQRTHARRTWPVAGFLLGCAGAPGEALIGLRAWLDRSCALGTLAGVADTRHLTPDPL